MIQLRPMTPAEFETWLAASIQTYADEKVRAGAYAAANAIERSTQDHQHLLPQGLATPDNYLYHIVAIPEPAGTSMVVGVTWLAVPPWQPPMTFIYDIEIYPEHRRHGYASQALAALEDKTRALGLGTIALHVFGHNHAARALYEKLGYEITDLQMVKKVRPTP